MKVKTWDATARKEFYTLTSRSGEPSTPSPFSVSEADSSLMGANLEVVTQQLQAKTLPIALNRFGSIRLSLAGLSVTDNAAISSFDQPEFADDGRLIVNPFQSWINSITWQRRSFSQPSNRVPENFQYKNFHAIDKYLRPNVLLQSLLVETAFYLRKYLGEDVSLLLELKKDAYDSTLETLFVRVSSPTQTPEVLYSGLDKFEREWWLERTGFMSDSPVVVLA